MVRAFLRAALFGGVFLALWTLAQPASAAVAPLCDDRGASAVAGPPLLEAPDEGIARAAIAASGSASCSRDELPYGASVSPAHKGPSSPAWSAEQALPFVSPRLVLLAGDDLAVAELAARPPDGVRVRVERPPRG
jgi:hypothetical protein